MRPEVSISPGYTYRGERGEGGGGPETVLVNTHAHTAPCPKVGSGVETPTGRLHRDRVCTRSCGVTCMRVEGLGMERAVGNTVEPLFTGHSE